MMSMNKEAEALGTASQTPAPQPPPTYSYPQGAGGVPVQPMFTGNGQQQFAQNMQFSPMAPMTQLPTMQNPAMGVNHPTVTRANTAPPLGTQTIGVGATQLQPGMGVPLQPGLGSPQFAQQTGSGFAPGIVPQAGQMNQFGQMNPGVGQQQYVPYPVLVQPQPPAGPTAAQIGEQYMAQQYALCATGNHDRRKKYGIVGIICAIVFFPIGLVCMFADQEESCARCGKRL